MATTSKLGATLSTPRDENLRIELIDDPRQLTPEADDAFNREIARLAAIACGGPAQGDPAVQEGWRSYCMTPGGRVRDHDRIVLVWDGDRLVGFNGMMVEHMEPDTTLLWYRAAGTDPDYQGRGAFSAAYDTMDDPDWMTSFAPPTYWVCRTPNPVVYESIRKLWSKYPEWSEKMYPKITPEGDALLMDDHAREKAIQMAETLWPETELDPDTLVLKDFLGEHGHAIWRVPQSPSSDPGVNRFFDKHLRSDNEDALMVFFLFHE